MASPVEAGRGVVCVDVGGVLINYSFMRFLDLVAAESGEDPATIASRFRIDHEFDLFELGEITPGRYFDHVRDILAVDVSDHGLAAAWNSIYTTTNDEVPELIKAWSDALDFVCMTNTNVVHEGEWRNRLNDVLPLFKNVYVSHVIGLTKPMPGFFAHIAADVGVPTSQLAIVDDLSQVISECETQNLRAHLFTGAETMRTFLAGLA